MTVSVGGSCIGIVWMLFDAIYVDVLTFTSMFFKKRFFAWVRNSLTRSRHF